MPMFPRARQFAGLGLVASLCACASVNPMAMAKLAALDPLSADAAQISAAARLPDSLKLRNGDLVLRIKIDSKDSGMRLDERFLLDVRDGKPGDAGTISTLPGERLQLAKVAEADLPRLSAVQAKAKAHKAKAQHKGEGSLSISIEGGCKTAEPSTGALPISIYLSTEVESGYYPVISNMDLRKQFGNDLIAKIEPCRS
jgi:hypothetical protein